MTVSLKSLFLGFIILVLAYNQFLLHQLKEGITVSLPVVSSVQNTKNVPEPMMKPTSDDLDLMKAGAGAPGTQHIHADFAVYMNGRRIDFSDKKYVMKSSLIHLDTNSDPAKQSSLLHMHATGVPFGAFFRSLGMDMNEQCFTLDTGKKFCGNERNVFLLYVNGERVKPVASYIPKDRDQILVTYGDPSNQQELFTEIGLITDFAKNE